MGIDLAEIPIERHVHERGGTRFWAMVKCDFFLHNQPAKLRQALGIEQLIVKVAGEPRGVNGANQQYVVLCSLLTRRLAPASTSADPAAASPPPEAAGRRRPTRCVGCFGSSFASVGGGVPPGTCRKLWPITFDSTAQFACSGLGRKLPPWPVSLSPWRARRGSGRRRRARLLRGLPPGPGRSRVEWVAQARRPRAAPSRRATLPGRPLDRRGGGRGRRPPGRRRGVGGLGRVRPGAVQGTRSTRTRPPSPPGTRTASPATPATGGTPWRGGGGRHPAGPAGWPAWSPTPPPSCWWSSGRVPPGGRPGPARTRAAAPGRVAVVCQGAGPGHPLADLMVLGGRPGRPWAARWPPSTPGSPAGSLRPPRPGGGPSPP